MRLKLSGEGQRTGFEHGTFVLTAQGRCRDNSPERVSHDQAAILPRMENASMLYLECPRDPVCDCVRVELDVHVQAYTVEFRVPHVVHIQGSYTQL